MEARFVVAALLVVVCCIGQLEPATALDGTAEPLTTMDVTTADGPTTDEKTSDIPTTVDPTFDPTSLDCADLLGFFDTLDTDASGALSETELAASLEMSEHLNIPQDVLVPW